MSAQGRNQGFHVLDEFNCEAIHAPSIPLASPAKQGRNEGMTVVDELVVSLGTNVDAEGITRAHQESVADTVIQGDELDRILDEIEVCTKTTVTRGEARLIRETLRGKETKPVANRFERIEVEKALAEIRRKQSK